MYNKILKKYNIFKIFTLSLPKKNGSMAATYYLIKYFVKGTPYGNINVFIKEVSKLTCLFYNLPNEKELFFVCSNKIFFYNIKNSHKNLNCVFWKHINFSLLRYNIKKASIALWYSLSHTSKIIAYLKNKKVLTIGFIEGHNQPKSTDFTFLLNTQSFSSIFIFHFILKKFIFFNVKN